MKEEFGGYYFKIQGKEKTLAVIAAYHNTKGGGSCSIQIISDDGVWSADYPYGEYKSVKNGFGIKLGDNIFSKKGMRLYIEKDRLKVAGKVRFGSLTPIKYDIMGPFCAVPFMECRHTVVSMKHSVNGEIVINGERYIFKDAVGYIEGDRGRSFPSVYAWTQYTFERGSLMLSVADIPIGPARFTGVIGVIMLDGKEHRIATYLGAKATKIENGEVVVKQGSTTFTAKLINKRGRPLAAPVCGAMERTIHESTSCDAYYKLERGGKVLFEAITDRATFEYEYGK